MTELTAHPQLQSTTTHPTRTSLPSADTVLYRGLPNQSRHCRRPRALVASQGYRHAPPAWPADVDSVCSEMALLAIPPDLHTPCAGYTRIPNTTSTLWQHILVPVHRTLCKQATNAGIRDNLNPLAQCHDVAELVAPPPPTYNGTPAATHVRG